MAEGITDMTIEAQPRREDESDNRSVAPAVKQDTVTSPLRSFKAGLPEPVKTGLRKSTRAYGRLTSRRRTQPDFLIIGTKRGGTTSLWNALVGHADVLPLFPGLQEMKSPHYFDIEYWRGAAWYRSFFPTRAQRRNHLRRTGRHALAGEASPYYMFHPLAAQRIAADLPDVKLIVSLRNPVDRIWSHYHERVAGHTEQLSFQAAIDAEAERTRGEQERIIAEAPRYYSFHHDLSTYLARGRYWEQLQRYVELFDGDQLLILRAEDYYTDSSAELDKISVFLGIDRAGFGKVEHYNRIPKDTMPPELRARLTDYYRPYVAQLETELGRSFGWQGF